jgi:hypothetical protein
MNGGANYHQGRFFNAWEMLVWRGWGQLNDGVSEACDSPNHLRVGGKVCSLTNNCVAHKV